MTIEGLSDEEGIAAGVAELRTRFPRTHDLYREVCVLLFFRHGITPTANKLYQLVRKGSMSAPTAALSEFWDTLRQRSRVSVEHADLPDELRTAAGEMVAALWRSAQTTSRDTLAEFQMESAAAVDAARLAEAQASAAHKTALDELENLQAVVSENEGLIDQLREELAAAAATNAGLEARLEDLRRQLSDTLSRADQQNAAHLAEREKLAERTSLAEQRFADMERRALLEIDRERTTSAKIQKRLESEREAAAAAANRLRTDYGTAQATIGQLREQVSSLQSSLRTLGNERDREREELQSIRAQLQDSIRSAAAESARADGLRNELERQRNDAAARPRQQVGSSTARKRRRKTLDEGEN